MARRSYAQLTIKRLYSKSGNRCAHPKCDRKLISDEGNVSDICHIEALNPDGPRYNPSPEITDKDRNAEPNLMLLCKNHHHIIDDKDDNGELRYSTAELKAMKRAHEDQMEALHEKGNSAQLPSLLAQVVKKLSETRKGAKPKQQALSFEIEEKIRFNEVDQNRWLIEKFAPYAQFYLDNLYDELEANELEDVLSQLNDIYLSSRRKGQSADDTLDIVLDKLVERLGQNIDLEYSEELEICSKIVMVDGFMRCKILESPAS